MATGDSQLKTEDGSPYPTKDIKVPHDNDILCGRGTETHRHVGNAMYRKLVNMNKVRNHIPLRFQTSIKYIDTSMPKSHFCAILILIL